MSTPMWYSPGSYSLCPLQLSAMKRVVTVVLQEPVGHTKPEGVRSCPSTVIPTKNTHVANAIVNLRMSRAEASGAVAKRDRVVAIGTAGRNSFLGASRMRKGKLV